MMMDSRLPLMAQQPDPLGAFMRGISAADIYNKQKKEQGKRSFLAQYGEALFAGDQNALSAYAEHDLEGAMAIKQRQDAERARKAAAGRAAGNARTKREKDAQLGQLRNMFGSLDIAYAEGDGAEAFDAAVVDLGLGDTAKQYGVTYDNYRAKTAGIRAELGMSGQDVADPMDLAKLEGQLLSNEAAKARISGGTASEDGFTAPQTGLDQDNNLMFFQTNDAGTMRVVEGVTPVGTVKTINTGTEIITLNSKTGEEIGRRPVNNEEAAKATELGKLAAKVELGGEAKAVEKNAEIAAKIVGSSIDNAALVDTSVRNIQTAIDAIDEGGIAGLGYNMLPDITEASATLSNALSSMGLDVVSGTTFGALSEGELKLAMSVAAPRDLAAPELRNWLTEKQAAQKKLAKELSSAARFLADPKNSLGDWLEKEKPTETGSPSIRERFDAAVSKMTTGQRGEYDALSPGLERANFLRENGLF